MRFVRLAASLVALVTLAPSARAAQTELPLSPGWLHDDGARDDPTFGYIQSVVMDSKHRLYALDGAQVAVLAFDSAGRLTDIAGRSGFGPGEFSSPVAVVVDTADRVLVLDSRQSRLSEFVWHHDSLVHVRDHRLPTGARDVCVRGDSVFTLGVAGEHLINIYTRAADGRYRHNGGFGVLQSRHPAFGHPIVRSLRSNAVLVCGSTNPVVTVARQVSELQWFDRPQSGGTVAAIEGVVGIEMVVRGSAVENRLPDSGIADLIEAGVLNGQQLLLSVGEVVGTTGTRNVFRGYRTIEVDAQGRMRSQMRTDWILGYAGPAGLVCYRNNPAPAVKVLFSAPASVQGCDGRLRQ